MATPVVAPTVLAREEGLRVQSGPGRDLIFKVTGDDTAGAFDYFSVDVAPHGGPPLHVHHAQDEAIHVMTGRLLVRIGDQTFTLETGAFAYMPAQIPHAFLNLTDEPAEIVVVFTPGGGHRFFEELGPATRCASPDHAQIAAIFERHDMTLLGPPLTAASNSIAASTSG